MSGLKYSKIELEKERKAYQEALAKINSLLGNIDGIRERINTILDDIPQGVKESFPEEIQRVRIWQARGIPSISEGMSSNELNRIAESLKGINDEGNEVLSLLIDVKEKRREEKARRLIAKLEGLRAEASGIKPFLNKWRPGGYENITNTLNRLPTMIENGEFVEVEGKLNQSVETLTQLKKEVTTLEEQDTTRRYVLEALRKVCKEMGWDETKEPILEEKDNPGSPLLYEVDTYYAGKVVFHLTLEGIKVDSQIPYEKGGCYKEFDNFSERLKRFGVTTKFERIEAPDEEPKLIQRGELDLPDEGIEMEMEA